MRKNWRWCSICGSKFVLGLETIQDWKNWIHLINLERDVYSFICYKYQALPQIVLGSLNSSSHLPTFSLFFSHNKLLKITPISKICDWRPCVVDASHHFVLCIWSQIALWELGVWCCFEHCTGLIMSAQSVCGSHFNAVYMESYCKMFSVPHKL